MSRLQLRFIICLAALWLAVAQVRAQGTAFTFQGRLTDGGAAASGAYDLQFTLFDAASSGAQQGGALTLEDVNVINGVYTVTLDFGVGVFAAGAARFLEIGVRSGASTGAFTLLTPRMAVASVPYAVRAANAEQLNGVAAGQYVLTGDARLTDARDPKPGSASYIQNGASQQASSNFNVSGKGEANELNARSKYLLGGGRILATDGGGNLFLGKSAAEVRFTSGGRNLFLGNGAGRDFERGDSNTMVGHEAGFFFGRGSANTLVGDSAGANIVFSDSNTLIGKRAGFGLQNGAFNTALGADAGVFDSVAFATAIGAGAVADRSNTVVLGRPADTVRAPGSLNVAGAGQFGGSLNVTGKIATQSGFNGVCLNNSINYTSFNGSFARDCNMDLAESFRTVHRTEPGDVVTLLPQDKDQPTVRKTRRGYDPLLIGVVSSNPGLIFDEGQTHLAGDNTKLITADKTAVAVVGRVQVKFTLENGPIKVGDALTSSATEPGKAMKATQPGQIIGLALESSDKAKDGKLLMWLQVGHREAAASVAQTRPGRRAADANVAALKQQNAALAARLAVLEKQFEQLLQTSPSDTAAATTTTTNNNKEQK